MCILFPNGNPDFSVEKAELGVREIEALVESLNKELFRYFNNANFSRLVGAINAGEGLFFPCKPMLQLYNITMLNESGRN